MRFCWRPFWQSGLIALSLVTNANAQQSNPSNRLSEQSARFPSAAQPTSQTFSDITRLPQPDGQQAEATAVDSLEVAWERAQQVGHETRAASHDRTAAEYELRAAYAQRLPTVNLDSAYTVRSAEPSFRFNGRALPLTTNRFPNQQNEDFSLRSVVNMPLYTSGRTSSLIDAATDELTAADFHERSALLDLKLQVTFEYLEVLRAQRALRSARSELDNVRRHFDDIRSRHRNGTVKRKEWLAAKHALSRSEQAVRTAQFALDNAWSAYNRTTGRPLSYRCTLAEIEAEPIDSDLTSLVNFAVANRPEILRVIAEARSYRHRAKAVEAKQRLQLGLIGEFAFQENRYATPEGIASVAVGASWNAFDGGRLRYRAQALTQRAESLTRLVEKLKSDLRIEVRQLFNQMLEAESRIEVLREAIEADDEALRVASRHHDMETGNRAAVLDARARRINSWQRWHEARYDLAWTVARLKRAIGRF